MAAELKIVIDDSGSGKSGAGSGGGLPGAPAPGTSAVSAFDRPVAVLVMGPKPLPVQVVDGKKKEGAEKKPPKPKPLSQRAAGGLSAGARAAGEISSALARNENLKAFSAAAGGLSGALSAAGGYGIAFGAAVQVATTAVGSFSTTVNAFAQRGRELAGINGPLAGASARADVIRYRADLREGQQLGPQLARLLENQAKADAVFREIMLPIKEFILDKLNRLLEGGLSALADIVEGIAEMVKTLKGDPADLVKLAKEIRDILKGGGPAGPIDDWVNALRGFRGPDARPVDPFLGKPVLKFP
jgi:hypothetical protein